MFDLVQKNRRFVQVFLVLITLPFAFFGIDSFVSGSGSSDTVATVGKSKISQNELEQALREQQGRLRQQFGREIPPAMLDSPQMRRAILDNLATQRILAMHAADSLLVVDDHQLSDAIQNIPAFHEDGKFSRQHYDAYIAAQGLSSAEFERRLRQEISLQQVLGVVQEGSMTAKASADRWLAAMLEVREVSQVQLKPEQFAGQARLAEGAARKFYDANHKLFETPEQLRAEYVVLSQDALTDQLTISDKEITDWYQAHTDRYRKAEERHASHILITASKDASGDVEKAAQAKAEAILAEVRRTPSDFARLAKQHSQDPGSAEKGGDLGWFARGMMVKPFEDVAFTLKPNEISGIVRSDFGFHIIRLAEIKAEQMQPLTEVKGEIIEEIKRQAAARKYAEIAESFINIVYEQADSLAPAVEKYHLTVQQSGWIGKNGAAGSVPGPLSNTRLVAALFSDDAIKHHRNTEAIEVAPNTLVAARVLEHKPASQLAFEAVKAEIEKRILYEEATRLAQKEGETYLAKLSKGEGVDISWGVARGISRAESNNVPTNVIRAIFKADAKKLPAYAGLAQADGSYALYRITQIKPYVAGADEARIKTLRQEYARLVAEEEFSAWLASLRQKYPQKINTAVLEAKERP